MAETVKVRNHKEEPITFHVDLKWSLWSTSTDYWKEYAPNAFKHLREGIDGGFLEEHGDTLLILTAPRKEIRFGSVCIKYDSKLDKCVADVQFYTEWDDTTCLLDTFGLDDSYRDFLDSILPSSPGGVGVSHRVTVAARTMRTLMRHIDRAEAHLIEQDEKEYDEVRKLVVHYKSRGKRG